MMNSNPSLARQVMGDLITVGRWPLVILMLIMLTALLTVFVTHETRLIIAQHDELQNEHAELEVESRNILLEEYSLSEHSRIETKAREELGMIRPDSKHEIIVSQ